MLQKERDCPGDRGGGERHRCLQDRERAHPGFFVLRVLSGGLRGGSQWNIHQLSRYVLSKSWSLTIGWCQGSGSLVIAASPDVNHGDAPPGLAAFLGLELKHNRGLDVICSAQCLRVWSCRCLDESPVMLFFSPIFPPVKGSTP